MHECSKKTLSSSSGATCGKGVDPGSICVGLSAIGLVWVCGDSSSTVLPNFVDSLCVGCNRGCVRVMSQLTFVRCRLHLLQCPCLSSSEPCRCCLVSALLLVLSWNLLSLALVAIVPSPLYSLRLHCHPIVKLKLVLRYLPLASACIGLGRFRGLWCFVSGGFVFVGDTSRG